MSKLGRHIASMIASFIIVTGYIAKILPFETAVLFFLWLILMGVYDI